MKRFFLLSIIFALILLSACSLQNNEPYTLEKNGTQFTVDKQNGTIFDGEYTYQFQVSSSAQGISTTITYPDGATYWWSSTDTTGHGGWSDDYNASLSSPYASGDTLVSIAEATLPVRNNNSYGLIAIILAVIGIWYIVSPHSAWYVSYGWIYKGAEPSGTALLIGRISGALLVVFALILMFFV